MNTVGKLTLIKWAHNGLIDKCRTQAGKHPVQIPSLLLTRRVIYNQIFSQALVFLVGKMDRIRVHT